MRVDVIAGRFALCDPIAGGSTGTVWRAWDLKLQRYCAAKVLRQRESGDLIRFTREQAVRLAHEHVLTPYSWVAEDDHVLIASDLIAGGSVSTLIGDWGPLRADTVAALTAQLLDGLAHVHETGLTHRDVKPGNLLLDLDGDSFTVRLADFGLAVRSDDPRVTQHGVVIGTPGYLSPEALAGDIPAPAQDLYAAGRVALALLAGHEPADGIAAPDLSGLPPRSTLAMVVRALLADDPSQRPAASTARDVLMPNGPDEFTAITAGGDPVQLAGQLPPFPDGWTVAGPDPQLLEPVPRPVPLARVDPSTEPSDLVATSLPVAAVGPAASVEVLSPTEPPGPTANAPSRSRVWAVAAAVIWLAALGFLVVKVVAKADGSSTTSTTSTTPATPPATTTAAHTSATSTLTPTAHVSAPPAVNGVCAFTQEGNEVRVGVTTVRCTRSGVTFRWRKA